jgi:DNA-binding MarR family transcriptional regulator
MPPTDPTNSASFLLKQIAQALVRMAEQDLRPMGLGMGSLTVLVALKNKQASTQAELARLLGVEQPSMAQMLSRLERDGLITRSPHPTIARAQRLALTPAAVALLPKTRQAFAAGSDRCFAGFSAKEQQTVLTFLKRMHENLRDPVSTTDG